MVFVVQRSNCVVEVILLKIVMLYSCKGLVKSIFCVAHRSINFTSGYFAVHYIVIFTCSQSDCPVASLKLLV